ncbi:MAG: helix-turn-helix domain-containing protein [Corynebacterium sp.]|nr:helix-turn-helix domain-containing protein [Corynebacterium sp.]
MFALHARYRGRNVHRSEVVQQAAQALATLDGVGEFTLLGAEDMVTIVESPEAMANTTMALLSVGDWAIGLGITSSPSAERAQTVAAQALGRTARPGTVRARLDARGPEAKSMAADIAGAFIMISFILAKRTDEGREATSLMRGGLTQNEAAAELGITKQAMSQRLQAAGWAAEQAGWNLAVHLIERATLLV